MEQIFYDNWMEPHSRPVPAPPPPKGRKVEAKRPKLSFNIICQDEEDMIGQCLNYVIKLGSGVKGGYEAVVVDGGSQDKTVDIVRGFAEKYPQIKLYENPWPGTSGEQRQFCLEKSHGEWIMVIDADEVFSDTLYTKINQLLARNDKHVFCFPKIHLVNDVEHMYSNLPVDPRRTIWRNMPEFRWSGKGSGGGLSFLYKGVSVIQHPSSFNFPWIAYVPDVWLIHFEALKSGNSLVKKFMKLRRFKRHRMHGWSEKKVGDFVEAVKGPTKNAVLVSKCRLGVTFYHEIEKGL